MVYAKRAKTTILIPFLMIPVFILAVALTFLGYRTGGTISTLYIVGMIVALLIGFLGGLIWLVCEIISIVFSIKARKNSSPVPIGFKILLLIEIVLSVLWIYGAWTVLMRSMSV